MSLGIEVEQLTLRYGNVTALDGLCLRVEPGKIVGLLGRNGSGKTSLLSVLAAFRQADGGRVRVGGEPVFENPRVTRQITLIREAGDTVADDESVETALSFAKELRPNWDDAYAKRLADKFELPLKKNVGQLSRGKRSALGVVLGLAARAPLTMFDETYLGMDAPSRYLFYDELLADYVAHPRTVILSTHLIEEVSRLFEEVVIIDKGRVLLHEETEALLGRGVAVTGPAEAVDAFVDGRTVMGMRQLGRTKSAMVFGLLAEAERARARAAGLDLEPVALQDLFVHLTGSSGGTDGRAE